jgi:amidase
MTIENSPAPELRSATALLRQLRERKIGSVELLEMLFKRIERLNPKLNAVVALEMERARADARAADSVPTDRRGVLHGLPITLKDTWEVAGMRSTCGLPELANHRPDRDAEAVALLRAAGAIPFGRTNVPSGAADGQSYNPVFGVTNNPWNVERTPGGSSGGAGAAVAAGLTPVELGSDIAGSIRIPAHFCGIFGHKSSYGVVPMRGHIPPPPGSSAVVPLGVAGPLARSAVDLELLLDILAAPSELGRAAWSIHVPPSRHHRLADFRVGLWADPGTYSVDARCVAAIHEFARDLRSAGVQVNESARPDIDFAASDDLFVAILFATISTGAAEEVLSETEQAAAARKADVRSYPARIARAVRTTRTELAALFEHQHVLRRAWRQFFQQFDVLLCPITTTVAFPHDHSGTGSGHIAQYDRTLKVDGQHVPYLDCIQWPGLATIANLPATAIPTGRLVDRLPMGVQAIGPYLEDRTTIRFAELVEQALGGYAPPPIAM